MSSSPLSTLPNSMSSPLFSSPQALPRKKPIGKTLPTPKVRRKSKILVLASSISGPTFGGVKKPTRKKQGGKFFFYLSISYKY